jgi:hypothetical protein
MSRFATDVGDDFFKDPLEYADLLQDRADAMAAGLAPEW